MKSIDGEYAISLHDIIDVFGEGIFDNGFHELSKRGIDSGSLIEVDVFSDLDKVRIVGGDMVFKLRVKYDDEG